MYGKFEIHVFIFKNVHIKKYVFRFQKQFIKLSHKPLNIDSMSI